MEYTMYAVMKNGKYLVLSSVDSGNPRFIAALTPASMILIEEDAMLLAMQFRGIVKRLVITED